MDETETEPRPASAVLIQVRDAIDRHDLLPVGEPVVVGVSGGPDSLCLLHVLRTLAPDYAVTLHVAHLHHGLREADADADATFVQSIAAEWGLPVTIGRADVPDLARSEGLAIEEAARRARYAFLRQVALDVGARTIAVGHNADDQAETVLMHFIRGSGLAGLRGMLPRTPLSDYRLVGPSTDESTTHESTNHESTNHDSTSVRIHLIRPLLTTPRAAILAYCAAYDLHPRFDRSNLDTTYFRNWLRHEVIPLLEQHNPGVQEVIRRTAGVVADDYALMRLVLAETWPQVVVEETLPPGGEGTGGRIVLDLAAWRALPVALQRSTLREAVHRLRHSLRNINFVHIEDAVAIARGGMTGDQATLPRGLSLTVGYDRLTVEDVGAGPSLPDWPLLPAGTERLPVALPGVTLSPGGNTLPGGKALPGGNTLPEDRWLLHARLLERQALPPGWQTNPDPWQAFLDAGAAGAPLYLRTRRPGDRFDPLGLDGHTVKLADFLTNAKVPQIVRDHLPLLAGEDGIVWVCGLRPAHRARVRDDTPTVLALHFELT